MAKVRRLIAPRVRASVNLQDPQAAENILAAGRILVGAVEGIEQMQEVRAGARRVSEATRLATEARISLDRWSAEQEPFDEEGNPRFESVGNDFEGQFDDVLRETLGRTQDNAVKSAVEKSLLSYREGATGDWLVRSQKWETGHALGELNGSLLVLQTDALSNPDNAKNASAQALAALEENVKAGFITPAAAQNKFVEFNLGLAKGQFRSLVEAEDFIRAGNVVKIFKTMPGATSDQVRAFQSELVTAQNAKYTREEKANKVRQEKTLLSILASPRPAEERLQLLDDAVRFNFVYDVSEFKAVRDSLQKEAAPTDDPAVVKDFMDIYAAQGVTTRDLANVRDKVTAETYVSFARMTKTSQDNKEIFQKPSVKEAVKFLEDRMKRSGRMANRIDFVDRVFVPEAKVELINKAAVLHSQGKLTFNNLIAEARTIVMKYEQEIPSAGADPATPPDFLTFDAIIEASKTNVFGVIGSKEARARITAAIRKTDAWVQALEANRAAATKAGAAQAAPESTLGLPGGF